MDQASSISAGALKTFVHRCGIAAGLSPEDASRLVDGVVEADLRGVASHGVSRLPTYLRALAGGVVNPRPAVQVLRSKGAVEVLDADNGLGVIVGQQAMERAVKRAGEFGVGTVSVRNSNHSGMLAAHVLKAPPHGAVGFFTSNGPAIMAPFGGREPRLGNGPVAYAIPRRQASRSFWTWLAPQPTGAASGCSPKRARRSRPVGHWTRPAYLLRTPAPLCAVLCCPPAATGVQGWRSSMRYWLRRYRERRWPLTCLVRSYKKEQGSSTPGNVVTWRWRLISTPSRT